MGTNTTGSLVLGTVDGMGRGLTGSPVTRPRLTEIAGNPSGLLAVQCGSDLAFDSVNGKFYMGKAANDEIWIQLGSVSFA